jgi:hypothetical protein
MTVTLTASVTGQLAANRARTSVEHRYSHLTNVNEIGVDRRVFADREFGTIDQQRLPPPPYCVASVRATGLLRPSQFQTDSRLITFAELDPC